MSAQIATDPPKAERGPRLLGQSITPSAEKTPASAEGESKKGRFYKPLAKAFLRGGFEYTQIAREGDAAICAQVWPGPPEASVCYEVVRIRRRDGFNINGRFVEPAELYPVPKAWGAGGFSLTDKDSAFAKFRELAKANAVRSRFEVKEVE